MPGSLGGERDAGILHVLVYVGVSSDALNLNERCIFNRYLVTELFNKHSTCWKI